MTPRQGAALVLVVALALLGGSIAWAVDATGSDSWYGHHYAYGPAMMGLGYSTGKATPVNEVADARQRAQAFAERLGLKTDEVMHFERNYYVKLVDKQGRSATEVLVDPATGAVSLEYGPAMMWNTKYGMLSGRLGSSMMSTSAARSIMGSYGSYDGGMMGGSYGNTTAGMMGGDLGVAPAQPGAGRVSLARAHVLAQQWLDTNQPGTKVERAADAFPGYFTMETLRDGKITGMISVNARTGAVLYTGGTGRSSPRDDRRVGRGGARLARPRALVVDDERALVESWPAYLEREGFDGSRPTTASRPSRSRATSTPT